MRVVLSWSPKLPLYHGNLAGDLRKPLLITHKRRSQ
jgi:hypothetical protein